MVVVVVAAAVVVVVVLCGRWRDISAEVDLQWVQYSRWGTSGEILLLEHSVVFLGTSKKDISNDCVAILYARVLHMEETRF